MSSLASLLLGRSSSKESNGKLNVDGDLDALFRSNPAPPTVQNHLGKSIGVPSNSSSSSISGIIRGKKRKRHEAGRETLDMPSVSTRLLPTAFKRRKSPSLSGETGLRKEDESSDEDEDENEDEDDAQLEDDYLARVTSRNVRVPSGSGDAPASESSMEEDGDEDAPPPLHETHTDEGAKRLRSKPRKKTRYVPPGETPAQRDARTIFIGNIPTAVAKSKSSQKQLKRHIISRVPNSKIESIRFRSVAFAAATTSLPTETDTKAHTKGNEPISAKQQRQQERAAQWRGSSIAGSKHEGKRGRHDDDETSEREDQQSHAKKTAHQSPAERKRIAFIKGEFHKEADTLNAYVVFAHTEDAATEEGMLSEGKMLSPCEMARLAVERCDGTPFMDRTIRVDRVGQWRIGAGAGSSQSGAGADLGAMGDLRATLFVGNLDFATREEDLRVWFEGVVSQERGPPGEAGDEVDAGVGKTKTWVRNVRIVRDRDTQLGKGFAYVRFLDRECVDEVLGLEPAKLKFAKRKLRVQRCKVGAGAAVAPKPKGKLTSAGISKPISAKKAIVSPPALLPKGDPLLGERLKGLTKEARKAAKATNVDRVQRRLAKKKIKAGVEQVQARKKVRERERHHDKSGKGKAKPVNKGRMRSEKSMEKRNAKK